MYRCFLALGTVFIITGPLWPWVKRQEDAFGAFMSSEREGPIRLKTFVQQRRRR